MQHYVNTIFFRDFFQGLVWTDPKNSETCEEAHSCISLQLTIFLVGLPLAPTQPE